MQSFYFLSWSRWELELEAATEAVARWRQGLLSPSHQPRDVGFDQSDHTQADHLCFIEQDEKHQQGRTLV